jgi:hypothetical protein
MHWGLRRIEPGLGKFFFISLMFFYTYIYLQAIYATTTRKQLFICDNNEKTMKREQDTTQGLETRQAPDSGKFLYIYLMFNYTNI